MLRSSPWKGKAVTCGGMVSGELGRWLQARVRELGTVLICMLGWCRKLRIVEAELSMAHQRREALQAQCDEKDREVIRQSPVAPVEEDLSRCRQVGPVPEEGPGGWFRDVCLMTLCGPLVRPDCVRTMAPTLQIKALNGQVSQLTAAAGRQTGESQLKVLFCLSIAGQ